MQRQKRQEKRCKGNEAKAETNDAKARQGGKVINPHHHGHRHQTTSTNVINLYSNNNQADEDGQNKIHNTIKTAHPKSNGIPKNEFGRGKRVRSR